MVMPPTPGLSEADLEMLDAFLMSDQAPENCMQLSDLDGFLTAVAIGPELVMPSEWLPMIWGDGEPEFETAEQAQGIINAIMVRYNEILQRFEVQIETGDPPQVTRIPLARIARPVTGAEDRHCVRSAPISYNDLAGPCSADMI